MNYCPCLTLQSATVQPGSEWTPQEQGLGFCHTAGDGYLLGRNLRHEIPSGSVVELVGRSEIQIRASQLNCVELHYFFLRPDLLSGVATISEQNCIDRVISQVQAVPRVFEPAHPVAVAFTAAIAEPRAINGLVSRGVLLRFAGIALGAELQASTKSDIPDDSRRRFNGLLEKVTEAELYGHSITELAKICHCSERHFSRLFQSRFGTNLRTKQIAFRLERAKELLRESNSKVIHIALESGFRHVGHFNMMFKREFGATPSEWRQRALKTKSRPAKNGALLGLALPLIVGLSGWAAEQPLGTSDPGAIKSDPIAGKLYDAVIKSIALTNPPHESATERGIIIPRPGSIIPHSGSGVESANRHSAKSPSASTNLSEATNLFAATAPTDEHTIPRPNQAIPTSKDSLPAPKQLFPASGTTNGAVRTLLPHIFSTDPRIFSPDATNLSSDARNLSSDARNFSPEANKLSSDTNKFSPDARNNSPDASKLSPDAATKSSETQKNSSESEEKSSGTSTKSPDAPAKSPDAPTKSPDAPTKSPDAPAKSPDAPVQPPGTPAPPTSSPIPSTNAPFAGPLPLVSTNSPISATNSPSATTNAPANPVAPAPNPPPGTNAPAKPTFKVDRYNVNGNTLLTAPQIDAVLTNFVGSAVTVEQVLMAQKTLNLAYRRQGYVTVSTTLPPQKITNGVVQLNVTEGRLAEITVIGNNYYSSNNVMRALPGLVTNTFLQTQWFNPELDRANLNSDRQIYPEIIPGPEPGTSAIVLKVKDRLPLHARLEVNNQNTPGTPDMRVNTSVQYNNLWQYEHSIGAQYSFSPERMKEQNRLPERFYDHPLLANYSAYYRMPLTSAKSYRSMFADDPKSFGYDEATKRFNLPPSTGVPELSFFAYRSTTDTGIKKGPVSNVSQTSFLRIDTYDSGQDLSSSDSLGARVTFPLPEIKSVKSSVSAGIDFKSYRATSYNTNNFPYTITVFDAFGVPTAKTTLISAPQPSKFHALTYLPMNLRWDGGVADKWGQNSFFAGFLANIPVLSSSADFKGLAGGQARNDFLTTVLGVSREQRLPKGYSILFRADGQWANLPLASNEQYGIAGSSGVRGYQDGEQFGDSGWKVSIEPRTPFFDIGMVDATEPMRVRGSLFMDYGMTFSNDPARGATKSLWGAGVGLQTLISTLLDARLSIGWALNESKISPAGSYRVTFAVGANF